MRRAPTAMGLAYATSNRDACHLRANPNGHDFGFTEIAGKAKVVKASQDFIAAIETCERIWNLEREFNLAAGPSMKDDTLTKRLLTEPAASGTGKGLV